MRGRNGTLVTLIILGASSGLESVAILRLRLCGRAVIAYPMQDRHFHVIRFAGMYHYLVEDMVRTTLFSLTECMSLCVNVCV